MSDQGHRDAVQASPDAAERRPLTPDELKQFDAMLGIARGDGPKLTRRGETRPDDQSAGSRLLNTVIVAIILIAIVAAAFFMFR